MSTAPQDVPLALPAECDVIMKGGITSGVVYPLAVVELSKAYRFRNIGGTSAGAIAAALTAAAELGRGKQDAGFDELEKLPEFLGTRLHSLFQPSPGTRPAFTVLLSLLGEDSWGKKAVRAIGRILPFYGLTALLGALLGAALWFLLIMLPLGADRGRPGTGIVWGVAALVSGGLGVVVHFLRGSWSALNTNGFGLCNGLDQIEGQEAPLTPWLAEELNRTAGRDPKGEPLTFGHLWGGGDEDREAQDKDHALRKVNLEVMTTNLTHGWPLRIPFATRDLFFDPEELRDYFPENIVRWMEDHPRVSKKPESLTGRIIQQSRFRPLPEPWNLPVVVATRMSLSFPGLISAIPLYGVDWRRPENQKETGKGLAPKLDRCWFSDGGIGSNFPVHFFDGLLPSRPTFGINLRPFTPDQPQDFTNESNNVQFPETSRDEVLPTWTPIPNVWEFAKTILYTMQNWVDNAQMRLPGYRDRVVHVLLAEDEGGMNLAMSPTLIGKLILRGGEAGRKLAGFNWNGHRWTRYLTAMSQLQVRLGGMQKVYKGGFRDFLKDYDCSRKPYAHTAPWKGSAIDGTDSMMKVIEDWNQSAHPLTDGAPHPETELRIGPKR